MRIPNDTAALRVVQREPDDDDAMEVEGVEPLLPERWIEAKFIGHETRQTCKVPKVVLRFQITEPGEFFGRKLERHFRTRKLLKPMGANGRFVLNQQSDLFALLIKLTEQRGRTDRISLRSLKHLLFRIKPRTVKQDHRQKERPEAAWYSVVGEIERGE